MTKYTQKTASFRLYKQYLGIVKAERGYQAQLRRREDLGRREDMMISNENKNPPLRKQDLNVQCAVFLSTIVKTAVALQQQHISQHRFTTWYSFIPEEILHQILTLPQFMSVDQLWATIVTQRKFGPRSFCLATRTFCFKFIYKYTKNVS